MWIIRIIISFILLTAIVGAFFLVEDMTEENFYREHIMLTITFIGTLLPILICLWVVYLFKDIRERKNLSDLYSAAENEIVGVMQSIDTLDSVNSIEVPKILDYILNDLKFFRFFSLKSAMLTGLGSSVYISLIKKMEEKKIDNDSSNLLEELKKSLFCEMYVQRRFIRRERWYLWGLATLVQMNDFWNKLESRSEVMKEKSLKDLDPHDFKLLNRLKKKFK